MKTENTKKQEYFPPIITCIRLDNEISLALESDPPFPEGETRNNIPGCITDDPYKTFTV